MEFKGMKRLYIYFRNAVLSFHILQYLAIQKT